MSATALSLPVRSGLRRISWLQPVVLWGILGSRLLVVLGAAISELWRSPMAGWRIYDPAGISYSFGGIGNLLSASAVRWDALHYLTIAQHGYATRGLSVFFPLYPALVHAVAFLTRSYVIAGTLVSLVSLVVALNLLHRLTELELGRKAADATVLLLAFAPLSFFFSAVYTESLFLAISVGAIYAARRGRLFTSVSLATLAAVTRVPGVLVAVPVALLLWDHRPRPSWSRLASLVLPFAGLAGYLAYCASRGWGWLAPITNQTGPQHSHLLSGPLATVAYGLLAVGFGIARMFSHGVWPYDPSLGGPFYLGFESILLFAVLILAGVTLTACFRRLPRHYGIYSLLVLLACVFSPTQYQPLRGLDRYVLIIFPLWMAAGAWLAERQLLRPALVLGGGLLFFYAFQAAAWVFIA